MTRATHHAHTTSRISSATAFRGLPTAIDSGMNNRATTATIVASVALAITRMRRALTGDARTPGALRHRAVEHLDHVEHRQLRPARPEPGFDLQHAAGVRADDRTRAGCEDRVDLAAEEPVRVLGLREVVRARAAAADVRVGHLDELEAVHARQEVARLLADPLRVREMTG